MESLLAFNLAITERVYEHRSDLCKIVIDKQSDDDKIRLLRESILKYRSHRMSGPEKEPVTAEKKAPPTEEVKRTIEQFWQEMSSNIALIESVTERMEIVTIPLKKHDELLASIAEVIRSEKSADEKVEAISNLLM